MQNFTYAMNYELQESCELHWQYTESAGYSLYPDIWKLQYDLFLYAYFSPAFSGILPKGILRLLTILKTTPLKEIYSRFRTCIKTLM